MSSSPSLLLFGDGSFNLRPWIDQIVQSQQAGSLMSRYVGEVTRSLRNEVSRSQRANADHLPPFTNLLDLSRQSETEPLHPALHAALVVLVQLGALISAYERNASEPFPDRQSPCLGFCLGEISAFTMSISQSLLHVVEIAPAAVLAAFKIGLIASQARESIEPKCGLEESWTMAVDKAAGIDGTMLEKFHNQKEISPSRSIWIGFFGRKTISVCGPPSSLRDFQVWLKEKGHLRPQAFLQRVEIRAPYHAAHLHSRQSINRALQNVSVSAPSGQVRPFIGSTTGLYPAFPVNTMSNADQIFGEVAESILVRHMEWQKTHDAVVGIVSSWSECSHKVRPFGPSSIAHQLKSSLSQTTSLEVDEAFSSTTNQLPKARNMPVAVVGMAMRLPGSTNVDELWQSLCDGKDFAQKVPKDRFDPETHLKGPAFGCFIDDIGHFDARFFNMSPREAAQTDPGHRLTMMTALEAMENAGLVVGRTPSTSFDRIGTFYGQTVDEYKQQNMALNVDTYYIPGSLRAFAPGRLNYFFKFGGPAYAIDTACSSGAVAMNLACKSIWSGECDTVLAGGINTLCGCDNFNGLISGRFLSATGNCKTFDHGADGYCRAEGVCSLVLKRLDAAEADHDNILGLISATETNFAAEAVSITRPHGPTQQALYHKVLQEAGLQPCDVDYVELHGTGTQAGDQVETSSVMDVFAPESGKISRKLFLSAMKPNLGHSEAASGPTSLIKALKIFQEEKFPPHIGIKTVRNKLLPDFDQRNVCVPTEVVEYPQNRSGTRRALVSNFSAAGGCTAFIVEENPKPVRISSESSRQKHPVCVSAKTKTALISNISRLRTWLSMNPEASLSDISYTSSARRAQYVWQKTFAATSISELQQQMSNVDIDQLVARANPKFAFAFTGQGSLYQSVAADLYKDCSVFRDRIYQYHAICTSFGFPSFMPLIEDENIPLDSTTPSQSHLCILSIEMALTELWKSWGLKTPSVVIGHSLGEYSALFAAGVLSASDALYLVGERARLLEAHCTPGTHSMLAVQTAASELSDLLDATDNAVEIACVNGPDDTVLSGPCENIAQVVACLKKRNVKCTVLDLPYGFHSSQVEAILEPFEEIAKSVVFSVPKVPVASTLLGKVITDVGTFNASYLTSQCRKSVDFVGALCVSRDENYINSETIWLEIGPQPLCARMINATLSPQSRPLFSLKKSEDPWASLCTAAASASDSGISINWQNYHADFENTLSLLALPTYSFELKNYWIEYNDFLLNREPPTAIDAIATSPNRTLLTTSLHTMVSCEKSANDAFELSFETDLSERDIHAAVTGHLVHGIGLCPASVYGDIALTIGDLIRTKFGCATMDDGMNIATMSITKPITISKTRPETALIMNVTAKAFLGQRKIHITYALFGDDAPRATCILEFVDGTSWRSQWSRTNYLAQRSIRTLATGVETGTTHKFLRGMVYKLFSNVVDYDSKYQAMNEVMMNSEELEATAILQLYNQKEGGHYFCSPFWIDAIVHLAGFVMNANESLDTTKTVYISKGWDAMKLSEAIDPDKEYRVYVKMIEVDKGLVAGDVVLLRDNETVGMVENLKYQMVPRKLLETILGPNSSSHQDNSRRVRGIQTSPPILVSEDLVEKSTSGQRRISFSHDDRLDFIHKAIATEIGVSSEELTDNTDFAQLGVDSLLSLTITSKLEQELGVSLRSDLLLEYPSISKLKSALETFVPPTLQASSESVGSSSTDTGPVTPTSQPANHVMSSARRIMAQQIGVDEQDLIASQDLSQFGIDSLMSWEISGALEAELGIIISAEAFVEKNSMQKLEELLSRDTKAPTQFIEVCRPVRTPVMPTVPLITAHPCSRRPILLHQGNGQRCVFLFPDGGGSAAAYSALPRIDGAIDTWALSMPDSTTGSESIEDFADVWLDQIRQVQPRGPYHFAGWSAGGFFALETTRKFLEQGDEVQNVVLIDSPCPLDHEPMPLELLECLLIHNVVGGKTCPDARGVALTRLRESFQRTIKALKRYRPSPLDANRYPLPKTAIIWAKDGVEEALPSDDVDRLLDGSSIARFLLERRNDCGPCGWEKLTSGEIISSFIIGHHFSIVQKPFCSELSRLLGEVLTGKMGSDWTL